MAGAGSNVGGAGAAAIGSNVGAAGAALSSGGTSTAPKTSEGVEGVVGTASSAAAGKAGVAGGVSITGSWNTGAGCSIVGSTRGMDAGSGLSSIPKLPSSNIPDGAASGSGAGAASGSGSGAVSTVVGSPARHSATTSAGIVTAATVPPSCPGVSTTVSAMRWARRPTTVSPRLRDIERLLLGGLASRWFSSARRSSARPVPRSTT